MAHRSIGVWYTFKIKQVLRDRIAGQLSYYWEQVTTFSRYRAKNASFVMCLNCPSDMRKALQMKLGACDAHTIAKWHEIFLETVRDMYDRSVWSLRDWVRNAERVRTNTSLYRSSLNGTRLVGIRTTRRIANFFMRLRGISSTPTRRWMWRLTRRSVSRSTADDSQ